MNTPSKNRTKSELPETTMINQLEDKQSLALAIVSFMYFHRDPLSIFCSPNSVTGEMDMPLWLCKETGAITCRNQKSVLFKGKDNVIALPITVVPAQTLAENHDLTTLEGRKSFILDLLKFVLTYWWSEPHKLEEIGLGLIELETLKKNLAEPKFTYRGKLMAQDVLENVVMPILLEGMHQEFSTPAILH